MKKAALLFSAFFLSGCAFLNPYESDFSCPEGNRGKCVSVQQAYEENGVVPSKTKADAAKEGHCTSKYSDVDGAVSLETVCTDPQPATTSAPAATMVLNQEDRNYNHYRSALFEKFNGLLKEPVTPVVAPPKAMRVLLLPYTGQENEFYMLRYVYFFVDEPRWILGDSVLEEEEE